MNIKKSNVFIGDLMMCTKFYLQIISVDGDCGSAKFVFDGTEYKKDIPLIKFGPYFVPLTSINGEFKLLFKNGNNGNAHLKNYYKSVPIKLNGFYIKNAKHAFPKNEKDELISVDSLQKVYQKNNINPDNKKIVPYENQKDFYIQIQQNKNISEKTK